MPRQIDPPSEHQGRRQQNASAFFAQERHRSRCQPQEEKERQVGRKQISQHDASQIQQRHNDEWAFHASSFLKKPVKKAPIQERSDARTDCVDHNVRDQSLAVGHEELMEFIGSRKEAAEQNDQQKLSSQSARACQPGIKSEHAPKQYTKHGIF